MDWFHWELFQRCSIIIRAANGHTMFGVPNIDYRCLENFDNMMLTSMFLHL